MGRPWGEIINSDVMYHGQTSVARKKDPSLLKGHMVIFWLKLLFFLISEKEQEN
jgi:hypothetical protein